MKRTFKKAVSVFLVVAMLLCAAPLNGFVGLDLPSLFDFKAKAATYSGTCGTNVQWSLNTDTGALNIIGTGNMKDYIKFSSVPWNKYCSDIKTVNIASGVTSIGQPAFNGCSSLTSITIPDSVTRIGSYAFENCSSLVSITIPDSVTSIGDSAFSGCSSLTSVTIPDGVTSIGYQAFYGCSSLTSITIPDGVTSIGNSAFYNCSSLESITIPDGVTTIYDSAFEGCSSLASITIPDSVTSIGNSAFNGCSKLVLELKKGSYLETYANKNYVPYVYIYDGSEEKTVSVTVTSKFSFEINKETLTMTVDCSGNMLSFAADEVPWLPYKEYIKHIIINDGCTSISDNAFKNMPGIKSVAIPDGVTSIGYQAFYECISLTSITIPDSVTSIGEYAFYKCSSLTSVTIGNSVTSIGEYAFYNCSSLASVTIPDSVTSIGDYMFYFCRSLTSVTIGNSVTSIGDYMFYFCSNLTSVTIGNSVTSISKSAFYNCSSLESIAIGNSVSSIGDYAFRYCRSLTSITVDENNKNYSADEYGVLYNKNKTELIQYPAGNTRTSYTIPDSVTSIGSYAFYNCDSLASVTIGNSVTSIGDYAFYNCDSLTSVTIGNSVTSIGDYAFNDCSGLIELTMPISAKIYNDSSAFYNCKNIEKITLTKGDGTVQSYGTSTSTSSSSTYYQYTPWYISREKCAEVIIEDGVSYIGDYMFYDCTGITELTIPASAKIYNSSNTFSCCVNIKKITITKGDGTFQSYGTSTSTSSSSTYYQYTPWYKSREKCAEVIIEDGVTGIGDYMFYSCAELGDVTLPYTVQSIGGNAFAGCQKLGRLNVYNRNCEFETNATGYYTTIVGYAGSTAEAYANETGFDFEPISDNDHAHTYSNPCDNDCSICGYSDPDRGHSFDNSCDPACDACGYIRSDIEHKDENADGKCDVCEIEISDIQIGVLQNVQVDAGKTVLLKFVPYQSGVYTFTSSSSSDTYGYIYDADKKLLASDDESGSGSNFSITYTLKRGTVYYLGVKFYSSSASGEIPVIISLDEIICDHIKTHTEHMDSTCSQEGYDKVVCDNCGETVSTTVIATIPHSYKTIMAEPTCVDEGVVVCLCSVCRYAYIDEILDPLGHSEPVWKTVVKPTTSAEGTMNHVCPACDEVFDTKTIPAITLSGNTTANVNFTTNTITGFDAGSTELEDYLSATNNGYVFTCSSDILYTGAVVELTDGETLINSYTVVIFGDVDGDGWYDGEDAFLVNLIAKGMLSKDDVGETIWTAADCNHDGVIDETDVDLLTGAGLKLNSVDQSKPVEELATNSDYIEYAMLIDQSAGMNLDITPDVDDMQQGTTDTEITPDQPADEIDFEVIITNIFEFFKKIFTLVFSFIIK